MEIFSTIVTGVAVFILGELILRLFVEPIQELKKLQRQLIEDMSFYARIYYNATIDTPEFRMKIYDVSNLLRKNAVQIESIIYIIPFYKYLAKMKLVPNSKEISIINANLIGISNTITGETKFQDIQQIHQWAKEIEHILKVDNGSKL